MITTTTRSKVYDYRSSSSLSSWRIGKTLKGKICCLTLCLLYILLRTGSPQSSFTPFPHDSTWVGFHVCLFIQSAKNSVLSAIASMLLIMIFSDFHIVFGAKTSLVLATNTQELDPTPVSSLMRFLLFRNHDGLASALYIHTQAVLSTFFPVLLTFS